MRILYLLITILCLAWPQPGWTDAAPDPLNKGIRPHRLSSRVEMTAEQVTISLGEDICTVEAHFLFSNPSDTNETMEVGFPSGYPAEIIAPVIQADDKRIVPRISTEQTTERVPFDGGNEEKHHFTHWLLWDMTFKAGQSQSVSISYSVKPFDNGDYVVTPYTAHRFAIEQEFHLHGWEITPEVQRVLDAIQSKATGYILRTGSGWGGPIGKAVISVFPENAVRWLSPQEKALFTEGGIEWQFVDTEPDFDIFVEYNPSLPLAEERQLAAKAYGRHQTSRTLWEYITFLTPIPNETRQQFSRLKAAFPHGVETEFTEYRDIVDQKGQEHMRAVQENRPDLMTWLPAPLRDVLFDGDPSNGEGINYKLLKDGRVYVIMKTDRPRLPDGQKAELFEYEYLFYGYVPLSEIQTETMKKAMEYPR